MKSIAEGISRQLRAWAESLQESKIPGQRYLTEKTRRAEKAARDREQFLDRLRHIRGESGKPPGRPEPDSKDSQARRPRSSTRFACNLKSQI